MGTRIPTLLEIEARGTGGLAPFLRRYQTAEFPVSNSCTPAMTETIHRQKNTVKRYFSTLTRAASGGRLRSDMNTESTNVSIKLDNAERERLKAIQRAIATKLNMGKVSQRDAVMFLINNCNVGAILQEKLEF
jgi:hypothetical protein